MIYCTIILSCLPAQKQRFGRGFAWDRIKASTCCWWGVGGGGGNAFQSCGWQTLICYAWKGNARSSASLILILGATAGRTRPALNHTSLMEQLSSEGCRRSDTDLRMDSDAPLSSRKGRSSLYFLGISRQRRYREPPSAQR